MLTPGYKEYTSTIYHVLLAFTKVQLRSSIFWIRKLLFMNILGRHRAEGNFGR